MGVWLLHVKRLPQKKKHVWEKIFRTGFGMKIVFSQFFFFLSNDVQGTLNVTGTVKEPLVS